MNLSAFPKIFAMGTRHVQTILDGPVEVTEKIDGSQFVFGKIDGVLMCRSRGKVLTVGAPEKMFGLGVGYLQEIEKLIPNDLFFYTEFLQKPKHNTIAYNTTPKNHMALFGARDIKADRWVTDHHRLAMLASLLGIDVVPCLARGDLSKEEVMALLGRDSYLGGSKVEGVVIKNYALEQWIGGVLFLLTSAKYVSEKFKEKHNKLWKKEHTGKGRLETLSSNYGTEARWAKAVQHLREDGTFEPDPRMIGELIKEVQSDIMAEELGVIKSALWGIYGRQVLRGSTAGPAEWFKKELAKGVYDG